MKCEFRRKIYLKWASNKRYSPIWYPLNIKIDAYLMVDYLQPLTPLDRPLTSLLFMRVLKRKSNERMYWCVIQSKFWKPKPMQPLTCMCVLALLEKKKKWQCSTRFKRDAVALYSIRKCICHHEWTFVFLRWLFSTKRRLFRTK